MAKRERLNDPVPDLLGAKFPPYKIIPIAGLVPYVNNARTHSPAQVSKIAASIKEFGFTNPVLVDGSNGIVAGHGRVLAALKLDLQSVPVIELSHLTDAQRRAYILADNRLALDAGWDEDLLRLEFSALADEGFDLGLTGFGPEEIDGILAGFGKEGLTDPDDVPEVPADPVSVLGDLWLLGNHRLCCGDSTDADVVGKALGGVKPHLMVTDPPYGVKYDPNWRNEADRSDGKKIGARAVGKVLNDNRSDWREAWALFPGAVAYVWHAGTYAGDVAASLQSERFQIRAQIIWVKQRHVLSRGDYHHQHEPCFYGVREGEPEDWHFVPEHEVASYAVKKGDTGHYVGGRKQSTVWNIEHVKSETGHGTQKPIACMQRPIENNSNPGQSVYEPFSGSGTTIMAAQVTGRVCCAIELNPAYVDVGVVRWQNFTGQAATLAGDGRTFAQVQADRANVGAAVAEAG